MINIIKKKIMASSAAEIYIPPPPPPTYSAPVLSNIPSTYSANWLFGGNGPIAPSLTITDTDSTWIYEARVSFANGIWDPGDTITFTSQSGISGVYDSSNGGISFSGAASISTYQTLLRSIKIKLINAANTTRYLYWRVTDDTFTNSNFVVTTINITWNNQ